MSVDRRRSEPVLVRGKAFKPTEPKGRISLAYREINDVPRDAFVQPAAVKILDLSYNRISYPD